MRKYIVGLFFLVMSNTIFAFGFKFGLMNPNIDAIGGSITYTDSAGLNPRTSGPYPHGYTVHTFTSTGSFRLGNSNVLVDYLVVGGAGAHGGSSSGVAGQGGIGLQSAISGINTYYAGGASGYGGNIAGGLVGGGHSAAYASSAGATAGIDGLGGGGGLGFQGGSGIVIIRHKTFR